MHPNSECNCSRRNYGTGDRFREGRYDLLNDRVRSILSVAIVVEGSCGANDRQYPAAQFSSLKQPVVAAYDRNEPSTILRDLALNVRIQSIALHQTPYPFGMRICKNAQTSSWWNSDVFGLRAQINFKILCEGMTNGKMPDRLYPFESSRISPCVR